MKVLGKEVNNCGDCFLCQYISAESGEQNIICGYTGEDVFNNYLYNKDNLDCPFSKPITKEVIEGFGFNEFQKNCYRKGGTEIIVHENSIGIDMGVEEVQYYINNPVELEFILKSVGVL